MKKLALAALVAMAPQFALADVNGVWQTAPGDGGGYLQIQMYDCSGLVCGKIVKAYDADGKDVSDYQHLGKKMITGMQSSDGASFKGGKIWNPENDKTYVSTMQLSGNTLAVKGCVAGGLICKNAGNWSRVK